MGTCRRSRRQPRQCRVAGVGWPTPDWTVRHAIRRHHGSGLALANRRLVSRPVLEYDLSRRPEQEGSGPRQSLSAFVRQSWVDPTWHATPSAVREARGIDLALRRGIEPPETLARQSIQSRSQNSEAGE